MKISIGADERLPVVETALSELQARGHQVQWYGPGPGETEPWPAVARAVAEDVAENRADEGIVMCWTGTGVSIAANKVPGIRAALCGDAETARGARLWNNANILCLSMRLTTDALLQEILESWFSNAYRPNPTDNACLLLIEELDKERE